jgi:hypothetical protein
MFNHISYVIDGMYTHALIIVGSCWLSSGAKSKQASEHAYLQEGKMRSCVALAAVDVMRRSIEF